jgi:hypothetical protein
MKKQFAVVVSILACAALVLVMSSPVIAQASKSKEKPIEYSGRVNLINKDTKTITLQGTSGTIQVKYNEKTLYTYRNNPGTIDDVKQGLRVIVLADPAQKKEIVAFEQFLKNAAPRKA